MRGSKWWPWQRAGRARRPWRRRVALLMPPLMVVGMTQPAAQAQLAGRTPMPSLSALVRDVSDLFTGTAQATLPANRSGRGVGAHSTKADAGSGHAPGKGVGQIGMAASGAPKRAAGTSGKVYRGYNAATSRLDQKRTTATQTWYDNADGSLSERISQTPQNFRNAAGQWQPIDPSLVADTSTVGGWRNKAAGFSLSLASDASGSSAAPDGLVAMSLGSGESVRWSLAGAAKVAGQASGDAVTYPNALPHTNLVLTSEPYGVQEIFQLESAAAPNTFTFPLAMTGVSLKQSADGQWQLVDSSGQAVAVLMAPWAMDSKKTRAGPGTRAPGVSYALSTAGGVQELTLTVPKSWLDASSRVFPVTVDPSVVQLSGAGGDWSTYVNNACTVGCTNYSTGFLQVGYENYDGAGIAAESFLDFPAGNFIGTGYHAATAQLGAFMVTDSNTADEAYYVNPIASPWSPTSSMRWPGAVGAAGPGVPALDAPIGQWSGDEGSTTTCTINNQSTSGKWTYADLSLAAMDEYSTNTIPYYGLAITGYSYSNEGYWKQLASSINVNCAPYVYMQYNPDVPATVTSVVPQSGANVSTLTPTLTANATDPDPYPNTPLSYDFAVFPSTGGSTPIVSSGSQSSSTWTIPSGKLTWGQTYAWTVCAWDGFQCSPATTYSFSTTAPPPVLGGVLSQDTNGHGFNAATGDYTTGATDATIATPGPPLSVARTYNSLDASSSGGFGAGWATQTDAGVTQVLDPAGNVSEAVVTYPDGEQVPFGLDADGTYAPPEGRYATLTYTPGTGYTLVDKSGTQYVFDHTITAPVSGNGASDVAGAFGLSSVRDGNGRGVNYGWSASSGGDVISETSQVSARSLTFSWTTPPGASHPHISQVTTNNATAGAATSAQVWTYHYTGDQLTSVCAPSPAAPATPSTACTGYSYENGSVYQEAVTNTGAEQYWPLSDPAGSTSATTNIVANYGDGGITYTNVTLGTTGSPLAGSTAGVASFNGSSSYVTLPNGLVGGSADQTVDLWFKTSTPNAVLLGTSQETLSLGRAALYTPILAIGSDGKLLGEFWNGGTQQIESSAPVDNGAWHNVALTANGPSGEAMYLDGVLVGSTSAGVQPQPGLIGVLGAGYYSGCYADTSLACTYAAPEYLNGQISDVAVYGNALTATQVAQLYQVGARPQSLLTGVTRPNAASNSAEAPAALVSYNLTSGRVRQVTDGNGGEWQISAPAGYGSGDVYEEAVTADGPQHDWTLGDAAGATVAGDEVNDDASAGSTAGQADYNNVTLGSAPGEFTGVTAAQFNGTSSYMQLPSGALTSTPETIGLWFRTTGTSQVLVGAVQGSLSAQNGFDVPLYITSTGNLAAELWTGDANKPIISSQTVNDGAWHYAVLTAGTAATPQPPVSVSPSADATPSPSPSSGSSGTSAASTQSLYLDGALAGTKSGTVTMTNDNFVTVGAGWNGGTWPDESSSGATPAVQYFAGDVADVALYRTALSGEDVSQLWQAYKNAQGYYDPVVSVSVDDPVSSKNQPTVPFNGAQYSASAGYTLAGLNTRLAFQSNGNLVVTRNDTGAVIWSSQTAGTGATLTFQSGGTLVITNSASQTVWSSGTSGPGATLTEDANGDLVIAGSSGQQLWSSVATVPTATDVATYLFDPANQMRTVRYTNAAGEATRYGYDVNGYLDTTTDANGDEKIEGHDARGNVVSTTTCQNQSLDECSTSYATYYLDTSSVTDPRNDLVATSSDGRSASATDPTYQTTYSYDTTGNLLAATDPLGHAMTSVYTDGTSAYPAVPVCGSTGGTLGVAPAGLLARSTTAGGATTSYTYDELGDKCTETSPLGEVTSYTYDGLGRVLTQTEGHQLVGDWPLSQTSGTAVPDGSGLDNQGTAQNVTWSGGAAQFNGSDSQIQMGPPVANSAAGLSLSAWVDLAAIPSQHAAVVSLCGRNTCAACLLFDSVTHSWAFQMSSADSASATYYPAAATSAPAVGVWTHLVGEYDPSTRQARLYVNGALAATAQVAAAWAAMDPLAIGSIGSDVFSFDGSIADVQVYQRPLSAGEVSALYAEGRGGAPVADPPTDDLATSYTYDGDGRVSTEIDPPTTDAVTGDVHTERTSYAYDADGDVLSTTLSDLTGGDYSRKTTNSYNNYDQLASTTAPEGNVSTNDAGASIPADQDGQNHTTGYTYDVFGNVHTTTDPQGRTTETLYDPVGDKTEQIQQNTAEDGTAQSGSDLILKKWTYDPAGRLATEVDDPGGADYTTEYTYYDDNQPYQVIRTDGNGHSYVESASSYDGAGDLAVQVTDNGVTTTDYTYDADKRETGQTLDPSGVDRVTSYTYTADGYVASTVVTGYVQSTATTSTPHGTVSDVTKTYDAVGDVTSQSVIDGPATRTTSYELDQRGLPLWETDPAGNVTYTTYDADGRLVETQTPAVTATVASAATGVATTTQAYAITTVGYDTYGDQVESEGPDSAAAGTATTAATTDAILYGYDADGNQVSVTQPSYTAPGSSTATVAESVASYDGDGELISSEDPVAYASSAGGATRPTVGQTTAYQYTNLGQVLSLGTTDVATGADALTTNQYDALGDLLQSTDPTGAKTAATYDYLGRTVTSSVVERYGGANDQTTQVDTVSDSYNDPGGWPSSQTTHDGVTTSQAYDNVGEPISQTDAAGNTTGFVYDGAGRLVKTIQPNGTYSTTLYDEGGLTSAVGQYSPSNTQLAGQSFSYTPNGQPASSTLLQSATSSPTTSYAYDPTGLLVSETQPVSQTSSIKVSYGYDLAGNQTAYTDGNGNTIYTTYNAWNLPQTTIEPPVSTSAYTYNTLANEESTNSYDADGDITRTAEPGGVSVADSYDGFGDLTGQTGSGAAAATATRTFGYDLDGDVTSAGTANTANATAETFSYDDEGLLTSATGSAGASSFTYNQDALMASRSDASGTSTYAYDDDDRLQSDIDASTGVKLSYTYNNESQPQTITYGSGGDVRTFGYNPAGEVVSDTLATAAGATVGQIDYGYDDVGELTSKTDTAGAQNTYTYDQAGRIISWSQTPPGTTSATTTAYSYDADSNRTQVGANVYIYDARDELTSDGVNTYAYTANGDLSQITKSSASGNVVTAYTDDAYGQQITADGETYTYDASGRALAETGGQTTSLAYSGTGNDVAQAAGESYSRDPAGDLIGEKASGTALLLWTDLHTDVVGAFTATGTTMSGTESYSPLGAVLTDKGATSSVDMGYQSEFTDAATGAVNMDARWYNPATGQFMNKDTVSNSAAPNTANANPFAYADGDPLTDTDPTGHMMSCGPGCHGAGDPNEPIWTQSAPPPPPPPPSNPALTQDQPVEIGVVTLPADYPNAQAIEVAYQQALNYYMTKGQGEYDSADGVGITPQDELGALEQLCGQNRSLCGEQLFKEVVNAYLNQYIGLAFLPGGGMEIGGGSANGSADLTDAEGAGPDGVADGDGKVSEAEEELWSKDAYTGDQISADLDDGTEQPYEDAAAQADQGIVTTGDEIDPRVLDGDARTQAEQTYQDSLNAPSDSGTSSNNGPSTGGPGAGSSGESGDAAPTVVASSDVTGSASPSASIDVAAEPTAEADITSAPMETAAAAATAADAFPDVVAENGAAINTAVGTPAETAVDAGGGAGTDVAATAGADARAEASGDGAAVAGETAGDPARNCQANSFTGHTRVLLGNGKTVPIKRIRTGQRVLASDPYTDVSAARPVTHVIVHSGPHMMVAVTMAGGATVTATSQHPFWDASTGRFTYADALRTGDKLRESNGHLIRIAAIRIYVANVTAYNLTIAGIHTYYVAAGQDSVLVHNSCGTGDESPFASEGQIPESEPGNSPYDNDPLYVDPRLKDTVEISPGDWDGAQQFMKDLVEGKLPKTWKGLVLDAIQQLLANHSPGTGPYTPK